MSDAMIRAASIAEIRGEAVKQLAQAREALVLAKLHCSALLWLAADDPDGCNRDITAHYRQASRAIDGMATLIRPLDREDAA